MAIVSVITVERLSEAELKLEEGSMKNKLTDLNDHLFAQLERLGDEDLDGDKLQQEIARSKAVSNVAKDVVSNARLILDTRKAAWEWNKTPGDMPKMLAGK